MLVLRYNKDVTRAFDTAIQVPGQNVDRDARRWWVRGWGGSPSIGTDYVFLSLPHIKYLVNASYVLAPSATACLLVFGVASPRVFLATDHARFLGAASVPLVMYACLLRPFWGPFDWDLFALTAMLLALLAAHLLATRLPALVFRHMAAWLIGFQLLFVSVPFLSIGVATTRDAGPQCCRSRHRCRRRWRRLPQAHPPHTSLVQHHQYTPWPP